MPELNLQALYATQAAAVDVVFGLTAKTLDAYQKLTALGVQTMKESITDSQETVRKVLATKDRIEFYVVQASSIEQAAERGSASVAQANAIMAALREDFQQVADAHYEASKRSLQGVIDRLSQQTTPGDALSAWLAALASANTFCESVHQASKEAVELTGSQLANTAANVGAMQRAKAQSARAAAKL
ncbi:phasin family protein [Cupriavidus taiwanensis]|jgi:phasin family protein|uniref:phasin family protein n=1 Tax=Cupriavidus taiwanensis TaxID=164546 RepID=UPI000E1434BA|nr:phasin family protein [Cupriavidus taiwanensis]SOY44540.1 Phasin [Cupriavidus taiwanensis]